MKTFWKWLSTIALLIVGLFALGVVKELGKDAVRERHFGGRSANSAQPSANDLSLDDMLLIVSNKINETTPKKIDKHTTLDSTFVGTGRKFTYLYTLDHVDSSTVSQEDLRRQLGPLGTKYTCSIHKETLRDGVTIIHKYRGKDGSVIGDIVVSAADCE